MIWPFRRPDTVPDAAQRHDTVLDLIEQVAALRGHVRAIETEWDDVKAQVKKAYGRIERANTRADERELDGGGNSLPDSGDDHALAEPSPVAHGFAGKLLELQRLRNER